MNDFRVTGRKRDGSQVTIVVVARNKKNAQTTLERKGMIVEKIEKKCNYNYTVYTPNGTKVKGQQSAYSVQELRDAFIKHGYKKVYVEKVLIDIKIKPPIDSILQFINLSSFMLAEDMTYDKILEILSEEEQNTSLKSTLKTIQLELKKGREGEEVFREQAHIFGKFPAYMLGLATKSGNMKEVYQATAKFMERDREYKKSFRSALLEPSIMLMATLAGLMYYIIAVFPATISLFERFNLPVPAMTAATMKLSYFLANNWVWITLIALAPIVAFGLWFRTEKGAYFRDKLLVKIPVLGPLLHKQSIEIFFRVFATIYAGAENNIETLRAAAEACRNKWIEFGVKNVSIPMMLRDGASLVPALNSAKVFNRQTLNRLRTGTETGNVLASAEQIAKYYELETTYKMKAVLVIVQNTVTFFIFLVILFITLVSSEIALVNPPVPGI